MSSAISDQQILFSRFSLFIANGAIKTLENMDGGAKKIRVGDRRIIKSADIEKEMDKKRREIFYNKI